MVSIRRRRRIRRRGIIIIIRRRCKRVSQRGSKTKNKIKTKTPTCRPPRARRGLDCSPLRRESCRPPRPRKCLTLPTTSLEWSPATSPRYIAPIYPLGPRWRGWSRMAMGRPWAAPPSPVPPPLPPSPRYRQRWVVPILLACGMTAPFILIPPPPVYSFDARPCWPRLHSTTQKASSRNQNPSAVGGGQSRRDDPKHEQAFLICLFSLVRSAYCALPSVMYYQGPPIRGASHPWYDLRGRGKDFEREHMIGSSRPRGLPAYPPARLPLTGTRVACIAHMRARLLGLLHLRLPIAPSNTAITTELALARGMPNTHLVMAPNSCQHYSNTGPNQSQMRPT